VGDLRGQGIDPERFNRTVFTQFQTWLSESGSVEGCPVNCTYCFLKLDGQTPRRPGVQWSPEETVRLVGDLPTYHPDMPIHFGSQTDAFSTRTNIVHYGEVLRRYGDSPYPNPVVFITKRAIPDEFLTLSSEVPQPVVFYISYSGLGGTPLEPTVRDEVLRDNLVRLAERGLPRVHYWRPFVPHNASPERIAEVLEFVSRYARCSAVNGLKLNDGIRSHVAPYWPQLMDREYDFEKTGDFWPSGVRDFLRRYARDRHPGYPLFFDTACSLAFALGKPDIQGAFGGAMCADSRCPAGQRLLCAQERQVPSATEVEQAARAASLGPGQVWLSGGQVAVRGKVPTESLVYLRTRLRYPVAGDMVDYSGHNWASSVDADESIVEVPWEPPPTG
jgi:DNA repair photolyase